MTSGLEGTWLSRLRRARAAQGASFNLFDAMVAVFGRERFVERYYAVVYWWLRQSGLRGFNYGFAPPSRELEAELDLRDPFQVELYRQVAATIGRENLERRRVLEVSCGLGGGFEHIQRHFGIDPGIVVDRSPGAVRSARLRFGLDAVRGDARHLPFPTGFFDVVLNVEASHEYFGEAFVTEIARALAPGGLFALADYRPGKADDVREAMARALGDRFALVAFRDVSQNVALACELDGPRRDAFMASVPWPVRNSVRQWIGLDSAPWLATLRKGEGTYFILVARRT